MMVHVGHDRAAAAASDERVVLRGGTVIDPAQSLNGSYDVTIAGDRIVACEPARTSPGKACPPGTREIDCRDAYVLPGLVDMHSHIYDGVFDVAVPVEEGHLRRGVVAVNDAGSAGAATFAGFKQYVVERSDVRITSFLNVSSVGLINIHVSEFADISAVDLDRAAAIAAENPDIVRGIKVRLSRSETGDEPLTRLAEALRLGEMCGLPVMAHVGASACSFTDILERMRPGDIVTHVFHGKGQGLLGETPTGDHIEPAAWAAKERGVLFDVGHGTTQMSYRVARTAIGQGFLPDTLGSDLSRRNWQKPAYDLITVISKIVALGMPMDDAIRAATHTPAAILGLDGYGALAAGSVACVTVAEKAGSVVVLPDAQDDRLQVERLEPQTILNRGQQVEPVPWRGLVEKT